MKLKAREITKSAVGAAIMCIISPIAIHIGPIPITFSLLVLFSISLYFSYFDCAIIFSLYILLGLIGLPVFSGYQGGANVLFGMTGGFIWSYVISSIVVSYFSKKYNNIIYKFIICLIGLIITYALGTMQYCIFTKNNFLSGIMVCVLPFVIIDLIKIIISIFIYKNILIKYNI